MSPMRAPLRRAFTALALFPALACRRDHRPTVAGENEPAPAQSASTAVRVAAASQGISLRNVSAERRFWTAFPASVLPMIRWAPCVNVDGCRSLAPADSTLLPYTELGTPPARGEEVVVYFWRAVKDSGGKMVADTVSSVSVRVP
jgi:hypothetical protein